MKKSNYHNPNDHWYYSDELRSSSNEKKACFFCVMGMIIFIIIALLFSSCSTVKYVPVETVRTEYKHIVDTVRKTDSIFSEKETIIREADSALIAKLGIQLKNNEKAILVLQKQLEREVNKQSEHRIDTIIKTDSIQVPYPVEKEFTWWQKTMIDTGQVALIILLLVILVIIGRWLVKFKK